MVGLSPFACEALSELAFPAEENVNINIFYWLAVLISLGGIYLSTWSLLGTYGDFILLGFMAPFCLYILIWYTPVFTRTKFETKENKHSSSFNDEMITENDNQNSDNE